jgi:hypothetical protein
MHVLFTGHNVIFWQKTSGDSPSDREAAIAEPWASKNSKQMELSLQTVVRSDKAAL